MSTAQTQESPTPVNNIYWIPIHELSAMS